MELDLFFGALSSAAETAVLSGANRLAVFSTNGAWEVLAFADAQEIAPDRWRLQTLLRGLAGTEDAMVAGAAAGAAVVFLDESVVRGHFGRGARHPVQLAGRITWIRRWTRRDACRSAVGCGPRRRLLRFTRGHGGPRPVVRLTWVRRSRMGADDWDASEIALEPDERYRLEILAGGTVLRAVETSQPLYDYAGADELSDFGMPQGSLSVRLRQMGRAVPQGTALTTDVIVQQEGDA